MTNITIDNAVGLIQHATDPKKLFEIADEIARLTYTNIRNNKNVLYTAAYLKKFNANYFMVKILYEVERRLDEVTHILKTKSLIKKEML